MTPKLGDFGLSKGGGWAGWLIKLGTFSRYSHACVVVGIADDGVRAWPQIAEATPGGVRVRAAAPEEFTWSHCPLTDAQRQTIVKAAESCVGLGYDWLTILGFVLRFWGAKVRDRSPDHADHRVVCSELVAWAYRIAGHEVASSPQVAAGDVSPGDLSEHIVEESM